MSAALKKQQNIAVDKQGGIEKKKTKRRQKPKFRPVSKLALRAAIKDIDIALMVSEETAAMQSDLVIGYVEKIFNAANMLREMEGRKTIMVHHVRSAVAFKVPEVEGEDDCIRALTLDLIDGIPPRKKSFKKKTAEKRAAAAKAGKEEVDEEDDDDE